MGKLSLSFDPLLKVREQRPPLKVIRAFDVADGSVLVHLHNVSGGVLGGDCLELVVTIGEGAAVQLTTTGATRLYRARPDYPGASQINQIAVGENALLEFVPDAIIPYTGARYTQRTQITLADGSGLFWWEILAPGRSDERFAYQSIALKTQITAACRPIALEYVRFEPSTRAVSSPVRLGPYDYYATFYICRVGLPPTEWSACELDLATMAAELSVPNQVIWGVSALTAHGLVIRALSMEAPAVFNGLRAFWKAAKLRIYGREPVPPRKIY